jgi:hypothetical protein
MASCNRNIYSPEFSFRALVFGYLKAYKAADSNGLLNKEHFVSVIVAEAKWGKFVWRERAQSCERKVPIICMVVGLRAGESVLHFGAGNS